jgi:tetratricopeptide (TPR) repeat protein
MTWLLKCAFWLALAAPLGAQQGTSQTPPAAPASSQEQASSPAGDNSGKSGSANSGSDKTNSSAEHSPNLAPPRSDRVSADDLGSALGDSSSKDSETDLSAPADDVKQHPRSSSAVAEAEAGISPNGISEFHEWDPHKAAKDVEVGDFYFKRGNYKAAEDRYREALHYKENDAIATLRLAESLEKLGALDDARSEYESYLKILPHGPEAERAQKAVERLKPREDANPAQLNSAR